MVKINLATITRVGAITQANGENSLRSPVIDPAGGFAYFGTFTSPGRVVKIDLTTFERVGVITLESGESNLFSAVIDPAGDFAYFGTSTFPGRVVKIGLVPELTINKTATTINGDVPDPFVYSAAGDVISYEITAINTGGVTLTNVQISDPDVSLSNCSPALGSTLGPAATISCDGSYTVTQDDLDAGSFTNTATAEGTDPDTLTVNDTDSATANADQDLALAIDNTVSGINGDTSDPFIYTAVGDVISYEITATNTAAADAAEIDPINAMAVVRSPVAFQDRFEAPDGG